MTAFYLILLILAFVFFVLSAFGVGSNKVSLVSLGLACWVLVPLIHVFQDLK